MNIYPEWVYYDVVIHSYKEDLPRLGEVFLDEDEHEWSVREINKINRIWTNPPSPLPTWQLNLKGYPGNILTHKSILRLKK